MKHAIWLTPWDLAGRHPAELVALLRRLGLDGCNLALAYHGGRMLLPANPCHTVYEQHSSAVYFPLDARRYPAPLTPTVGAEAQAAMRFLETCSAEAFPVQAWTVLCHNDHLPAGAPECAIVNAFGEACRYGMCPSHPLVREYAAALCAEIAALPGVIGLDLEALGFMGYTHASLHGKEGIPLPGEIVRLLSICFCPHCRELMDVDAGAVRAALRRYFESGEMPVLPDLTPVLRARRESQLAALRAIRAACGTTPLNLRLALDPWFFGGKSTLAWQDLGGLADAATITFFGLPVDVSRVPSHRPVALHAGFVFHVPDCVRYEDVAGRYRALRACGPEQITFYSFSMAAPWQLEWLRRTLQDES